jgi:ATP-dependent protease Clp ATPase subunit
MDELRGRFHFITRTYDFDKAAMRAIVEKDIAVFNKTANAAGLELVLNDEAKDVVAEEAVALNSNRSTGARRITSILSALLLLKAHENGSTKVKIFRVGANEVRMAVNEIKRSTYWQEKGQIGFSA